MNLNDHFIHGFSSHQGDAIDSHSNIVPFVLTLLKKDQNETLSTDLVCLHKDSIVSIVDVDPCQVIQNLCSKEKNDLFEVLHDLSELVFRRLTLQELNQTAFTSLLEWLLHSTSRFNFTERSSAKSCFECKSASAIEYSSSVEDFKTFLTLAAYSLSYFPKRIDLPQFYLLENGIPNANAQPYVLRIIDKTDFIASSEEKIREFLFHALNLLAILFAERLAMGRVSVNALVQVTSFNDFEVRIERLNELFSFPNEEGIAFDAAKRRNIQELALELENLIILHRLHYCHLPLSQEMENLSFFMKSHDNVQPLLFLLHPVFRLKLSHQSFPQFGNRSPQQEKLELIFQRLIVWNNLSSSIHCGTVDYTRYPGDGYILTTQFPTLQSCREIIRFLVQTISFLHRNNIAHRNLQLNKVFFVNDQNEIVRKVHGFEEAYVAAETLSLPYMLEDIHAIGRMLRYINWFHKYFTEEEEVIANNLINATDYSIVEELLTMLRKRG